MFRDPTAARIAQFLIEIGIAVRAEEISRATFLPGLCVERGALIVDESKLKYPGDLLHEAGHLALLSGEQRKVAGPDMGEDGGFEMAAMAWSYAAARHIGVDLATVFHPDGYRGNSQAILTSFNAGRYFGVPMLEWLEMAAGAELASRSGVPAYPKMLRWVRA